MAQLIRFTDGVLVEVAAVPGEQPVGPVAGKAAERMSHAFQTAAEVVSSVARAVVNTSARALREAGVSEAEIEFAIGFSIEGSVYITSVAGEGNITVKIKINGQ